MTLIRSFQKSGNFLFKYRGQVPLLLFVIGIPYLLLNNTRLYNLLSQQHSCSRLFILIITLVAVLVSLTGFLIRIYTIGTTPRGTSGRNRDKQVAEQLNCTGIYSVVRHPLYLGNYLMWAGLLIFTMDISLFLLISLIYWLYYERIMLIEEQFIESRFGDQFQSWANRTNAIIPSFKYYKKGSIPFSIKPALRREYSGLFAMSFTYAVVDYLTYCRIWWLQPSTTPFQWGRLSLYVVAASLLIMLILRTLKHHTSLLKEPERD
jgi:protein-S-isoprenylcysteine O-methyltransferase Ste14